MQRLLEKHWRKVNRRIFFIGALTWLGLGFDGTARSEDRRVIKLTLRKKKIDGGARTIRVTQGDEIELHWTADQPASLHLHGYDLHASPAPGAPSKMSFSANVTGRFPITSHEIVGMHGHVGGHGERILIYLEIHPR